MSEERNESRREHSDKPIEGGAESPGWLIGTCR